MNEQRQFLNFKANDEFTDVELECEDGIINAHRLVLSARCSYFHLMFTCNMIEAESKRVKIRDIPVKAMELIVNFLYGDKIPDEMKTNEELIQQVLRRAHLMEIDELVNYCWNTLNDLVGVGNCLKIMNLAQTYDRPETFSKVLQFFNDNIENILLDNDIMSNMTQNQLRNISLNLALRDCKLTCGRNNTMFSLVLNWVKADPEHRLTTLKYLLNNVKRNDLSETFISDIVENDNFVKQHVEIRDIFISILTKRTNIQMLVLVPGVKCVSQKFCLREKNWFLPQEVQLPFKHDAYATISLNGDFFWFSALPAPFSIYNKRTNKWYASPGSTARSSRIIWAVQSKYIFVWNEKDVFARFDIRTNSWVKLAVPIELPCNRSFLVARWDKVYLYVRTTIVQIYAYDIMTNKWHLQTEGDANLAPVRCFCFKPRCECKLYFIKSSFWNDKSVPLRIYDTESNTWTDKIISTTCRLQICCVNCDNNIIVFKDIANKNFYFYHLEIDKFELIPRNMLTDLVNDKSVVFLCNK